MTAALHRHPAVLDELLVLRAQGGDSRALGVLARRWNDRLLVHACRLTGERDAGLDVVQEAWVAIVRGLPKLDDASRFPAWAYRIVGNKSRDWIRSRRRSRSRDQRLAREPAPEPVVLETSSEDTAGGSERLRAELRRLDPDHRVVLSLFYLEGFKVRQIAEALGLPAGTVKSRLFHARERLRSALTDEGGER